MRTITIFLLLLTLAACDSAATTEAIDTEPVNFDGHECAACGMIVRDQPAPRGQLVHRDGTRHYFCSVSDMLTYLRAPSPHGDAVAIYAEQVDPETEPYAWGNEQLPWVDVTSATYVLGVKNPRIMGKPILVYDAPAAADSVARRLNNGRTVDWTGLKAAHQNP